MTQHQRAYVVTRNPSQTTDDIEDKLHGASINALLWKHVMYNMKRFVIYGLTNLMLLVIGSLLFFYIEQCSNVEPKKLNPGEDSFMQICDVHLPTILSENNGSEAGNAIVALCNDNRHVVMDERKCVLSVLEFFKWMEYTFSVAFTIGYGRMVTRSDLGKIMTIIYAFPTITLSSITYIYCGQMVKNAVKLVILYLEQRILKRREVKKLTLKTVCLQLILCVTVILVFSWFFTFGESMKLGYLDSFYFVMVTLLTIGFGDIVVDLNTLVEHPYVFILGDIIFIFGLGILASLITSLADLRNKEVPVTFFKKSSKKVKPKLGLVSISQRGHSNLPGA